MPSHSKVQFEITREQNPTNVGAPKLEPRAGDTVRIENVRLEANGNVMGAAEPAAKARYVPGFVGVLNEVYPASDGWTIFHFRQGGGGVFAQVTILERAMRDGDAPAPKPVQYAPKVGDTVRVTEVSRFHSEGSIGFSSMVLKVGDVGELTNVGVVSTGHPYVPETAGFQVFSIGSKTAWCKVESYRCEVDPASQKKTAMKPCHWCGEDPGPVAIHMQLCNSCNITEKVTEVARELYRQRLEAGGLNDCLAERAAVAELAKRTVAAYRRPSCTCCGSKEGMPDGYGGRKFGLARSQEQPDLNGSLKHAGSVCIACVQKGFNALDRIAKGSAKEEPEPSAAPHWPAQHSTPGWED